MKRKLIYIGILGGLLLSSCNDFLKVDSPSKFIDDYIYSNEVDAWKALMGVYNPLVTDPMYSGRFTTTYRPNTDVEFGDVGATPSSSGGDYASYEPQSFNTDLNNTWDEMYKAINRANMVVAGLEKSTLWGNPSENILQMWGEAKTLRAMLYHDLIRSWGDVPFKLSPSGSDEDFVVEASDRDSILTVLIEDLIDCEPKMLYASQIENGPERASREFCQALIGRLALSRGGWTLRPFKDDPSKIGYMDRAGDWKEYYKIAETYLGKVVNEGRHSLTKSFKDHWVDECNYVIANDDDVIFDIPLLRGSSSEFCYYTGIPITGGTHAYGSASGSLNLSTIYYRSFDNDDLRRDMTCAMYGYNAELDQTRQIGSNNLGGVKAAKWNKLYMKSPMGSSSGKGTGVNYPYMRYAEVLLWYAEAVNENNNGPTPVAKEALKTVRRRAFAPENWGTKVEAYVEGLASKEDFFMALVDEQKWETGGENKRRYELPRWNLYGQVIYDMYHYVLEAGKEANGFGNGKYTDVPERFYYKSVENPEMPGRTMIEYVGFFDKLYEKPDGYTEQKFAIDWWTKTVSGDIETWGPCTTISRCFRGYITPENAAQINPAVDPVRYIFPYPLPYITNHKGKLQQYYGYQ